MTALPDLQMDVTGEYSGNAYPETHEYRIGLARVEGPQFRLWAEDTGGGVIGEYLFDEVIAEDGIIAMASINHGLDGYEDDWHLPDGMYRTLGWAIPNTPPDVRIAIDESGIDQVATWLRFALGLATYDGNPDEWEF